MPVAASDCCKYAAVAFFDTRVLLIPRGLGHSVLRIPNPGASYFLRSSRLDALPFASASRGERVDSRLHLSDDRVSVRCRDESLRIDQVLRTARIDFQQDEICWTDDRNPYRGQRDWDRASDELLLPPESADQYVDGWTPRFGDSYHGVERIVGLAAPHIDLGTCGSHLRPHAFIDDFRCQDEHVRVQCRASETMGR